MPLTVRSILPLLIGAALLSGCYASRKYPVAAMPVRLASAAGFEVIQLTSAGTTNRCMVSRADVTMTSLRGDTLHFSRLKVLRQAPDAASCAGDGPGLILTASNPALKVERGELSDGRTWAAILVVLPMLAALLLIIGYVANPGT